MRHLEDSLQEAIVRYVRVVAPQLLIYAVPNGGRRSKTEAIRLKRQGVLAGVFDLTIVAPGGKHYAVEVKTDTGSLSPAQRDIKDHLIRHAIPYVVVRSVEDIRTALAQWGLATRESPAQRF